LAAILWRNTSKLSYNSKPYSAMSKLANLGRQDARMSQDFMPLFKTFYKILKEVGMSCS
jgi:hypothetical protein